MAVNSYAIFSGCVSLYEEKKQLFTLQAFFSVAKKLLDGHMVELAYGGISIYYKPT